MKHSFLTLLAAALFGRFNQSPQNPDKEQNLTTAQQTGFKAFDVQKEFEKKKRAFLREVKMSKEPPTKKQLYYYDKLCKKYSIEKIELTSKLEARDLIDKIIEEHKEI